MSTIELNIDPSGLIRGIYCDELVSLLSEGDSEIKRASNVEPVGTKWQADMGPSGGPKLRLCDTRAEALASEVEWLKANRDL